MAAKVIKDPVHGYIKIQPSWFAQIIDTPQFQRLKSIEQSSFRILYPGARHDRFIHSLGTYYIAQKLGESFVHNIHDDLCQEFKKLKNKSEQKLIDSEIEKIKTTFLYAALLHDIGHAPFSHTTEKFFAEKTTKNGKGQRIFIHQQLFEAVNTISGRTKCDVFIKDFENIKTAPHEIISATILIKDFQDLVSQNDVIDLELAARMVIGNTYIYEEQSDTDLKNKLLLGIKNCFIRLLNSETIDADKLDYISRDTMMSGFLNIPLDIDRLTSSVTAILKDNFLYPAFRKNAFSVLDNVFNAKLLQATWVISHPVVLYQSALQKYCIREVNKKWKGYIKKVFSLQALGINGISFKNKKYSLLCDNDIETDLKKLYPGNSLIEEYYNRDLRRHPVWKSYYEFKYLFNYQNNDDTDNRGDRGENTYKFFKSLLDAMQSNGIFVLNEESAEVIEKEAEEQVKNAIDILRKFCKNNNRFFDFVLLNADLSFGPSFDAKRVYILFSALPHNENENQYIDYEFLRGESQTIQRQYFYLYSNERFDEDLLTDFRKLIFEELKRQKGKDRV